VPARAIVAECNPYEEWPAWGDGPLADVPTVTRHNATVGPLAIVDGAFLPRGIVEVSSDGAPSGSRRATSGLRPSPMTRHRGARSVVGAETSGLPPSPTKRHSRAHSTVGATRV
jgi:hypothetical protein